MHRHTFLILALLLSGCSDDDEDSARDGGTRDAERDGGDARDAAQENDAAQANDAASGRAQSLVLMGSAEGTGDEDAGTARVECSFSATIDMIEYEANGDFNGFAVGELFRTTYIDDGRFEFIPLIGGPASLTHTQGDTVELRFVGDQPDDAIEFWKQLEVVTGEDLGGDRYAGEWLCAPGLLNDPNMELDLTVPGEWTLEPGP
jgi:hypothetical protein